MFATFMIVDFMKSVYIHKHEKVDTLRHRAYINQRKWSGYNAADCIGAFPLMSARHKVILSNQIHKPPHSLLTVFLIFTKSLFL